MSPEQREKLSRLARERHAQGKFGDPRENGRLARGASKRQRITKAVAEAAEEDRNKQAIIQVFKDAIHPSQPMSTRLKGATAWADIAAQNSKMELAEDAHTEAVMSRDELLELLSKKLTSGPTAGVIREHLKQIEPETGIIDAQVVEDG